MRKRVQLTLKLYRRAESKVKEYDDDGVYPDHANPHMHLGLNPCTEETTIINPVPCMLLQCGRGLCQDIYHDENRDARGFGI
jgi:hypothetical protein